VPIWREPWHNGCSPRGWITFQFKFFRLPKEESVRRSWISRVKPLAGILALVMAVTFTAPALAADEPVAPAKAPAQPLSAAVTAQLEAMPVPAAAVTQETAEPQSGGKSFFKSRKGAIALVLMAGGLGYTLYSKDKDRIHSPIR
jgi:hypothetical protein